MRVHVCTSVRECKWSTYRGSVFLPVCINRGQVQLCHYRAAPHLLLQKENWIRCARAYVYTCIPVCASSNAIYDSEGTRVIQDTGLSMLSKQF